MDVRYTTRKGHIIRMTLYGAEAPFGQRPSILYCHGFKGFKDWGFVPAAGRHFAEAGFHFIAFNFSHNGLADDPEAFSAPEKFKANTHSLEVEECLELIHQICHTDLLGRPLDLPLGLLGHSRGGGVALLAGQQSQDVKAVCTWASVAKYDRYQKPDRQAWRKQGFREVKNSRTGEVFQMGLDMLDDIEKNTKDRLNIREAVRNMGKPLLLLHGQKDESVPYYEGEELNIFANPATSRLRLIPGTGHTFGTRHPFDGSNPAFDEVLSLSADFFTQHLR